MHGGTADTRQRLAGCEPGQKLRTTVRAPVVTRPADVVDPKFPGRTARYSSGG